MKSKLFILAMTFGLGLMSACGSDDATEGAATTAGDANAGLDATEFMDNSVATRLRQALEENEQVAGIAEPFEYLEFSEGQAEVTGDQAGLMEINELAMVLKENPKLVIQIAAFGGPAPGAGVSEAKMRALFIKSRLINQGVGPEMVETEGIIDEENKDKPAEVRVLGM